MKKKQGSILWTIAGLAIMAVVWYLKQRNQTEEVAIPPNALTEVQLKDTVSKTSPKKSAKQAYKPNESKQSKPKSPKTTRKAVTTSKADSMLKVARVTGSKFTVLKGSRLVDRRYGNDGDSFLVKHNEGSTDFRLYYVDTCESWYKASARGSEKQLKRLQDQGAYFGGLTIDQTMKVGIVAKDFVKKLLKKKPFTVVTTWENVYGPERKYAFIIVEWEGKKVYLHELLVAKGLVRIHTKPMPLPDSTSSSRQRRHLYSMETEAKAGKVGGWSILK